MDNTNLKPGHDPRRGVVSTVTGGELLGESRHAETMRQLIRKLARTEAAVFIHGPPGAGKNFVARQLFEQSSTASASGSFFVLDCAAHPPALLEQLLFGGSGSSATPASQGLLSAAMGGVLLLDEIAELPPSAQNRLMQFLEREREGSEPERVRLFSTTSRNFDALRESGAVRADLLFRLSIVPFEVPALADRREDIPVLADHFRQYASRKYGREILAISPEAMQVLQGCSWPGNVRELEAAIVRAVLVAPEGGVISVDHLDTALATAEPTEVRVTAGDVPENLHDLEKKHIFVVLERCGGNRTHAARMLGISIRTLRNKLKDYRTASALPESEERP